MEGIDIAWNGKFLLCDISNYRFQINHQKHHRDQQPERIERDIQRSRPQNSSGNNSSNGAAVNNVNNRVSGFSRQRETRDDDYARSEQQVSILAIHLCNVGFNS